jgi:hypothetical protein
VAVAEVGVTSALTTPIPLELVLVQDQLSYQHRGVITTAVAAATAAACGGGGGGGGGSSDGSVSPELNSELPLSLAMAMTIGVTVITSMMMLIHLRWFNLHLQCHRRTATAGRCCANTPITDAITAAGGSGTCTATATGTHLDAAIRSTTCIVGRASKTISYRNRSF